MKPFKQELLSRLSLPKRLADRLPSGYQRIGDIVLLKLDPVLKKYQREIGKVVREILNVDSVCVLDGIEGLTRRPKIALIAGQKTESVHKENGILYKLDVSQIMWSKGNIL